MTDRKLTRTEAFETVTTADDLAFMQRVLGRITHDEAIPAMRATADGSAWSKIVEAQRLLSEAEDELRAAGTVEKG